MTLGTSDSLSQESRDQYAGERRAFALCLLFPSFILLVDRVCGQPPPG